MPPLSATSICHRERPSLPEPTIAADHPPSSTAGGWRVTPAAGVAGRGAAQSTASDPIAVEPAEPMLGDAGDLRAVLRIPAFRQLWVALSLSSLGDWLGLLATTALASSLVNSYSGQSFAIGGVLVFRLLPAILLGPLAGAMADRFDRRRTMVVCDILRFGLFASIPVVRTLAWLLIASFLIEAVSLFWIPAKEASVPNLVPPERLEAANQLSLLTTYGSAAPAAGVFSVLALLNGLLASGLPWFRTNPVDLALYFDAGTFLFSAVTIYRLREIGRSRGTTRAGDAVGLTGLGRSIVEGWTFVRRTPLVRGLIIGILGAFASGGAIIATGKQFTTSLGGGNAAYGVLFGAVFIGLAGGMFGGPKLLGDFSRKRLFGLAIVAAGTCLMLMAVIPEIVIVTLLTICVGAFAGVGWVTGYTLLGLEVADDVRGRTFALLQSLVRIDLLATLAVVPFLVGVIGNHTLRVGGLHLHLEGVAVALLVAGAVAVAVGVMSFRQMDDRRGVPLLADLLAGVRGRQTFGHRDLRGVFLAVEGGDGAGKSTQVRLLADWLLAAGYDVVVTREPGATPLGARVRSLLLDPASGGMSPRAEALLYAADRAEHVNRVVRPALERDAVVITDRYSDSSLAYQGVGRELHADDVARLSRWATEGLHPDLTILLDLDPEVGFARISRRPADRMESESRAFHVRVRQGFQRLATAHPNRYLVVPAAESPQIVHGQIRTRVERLLAGTADPRGAQPGGAQPGGAHPGGAQLGGAHPVGADPGGAHPAPVDVALPTDAGAPHPGQAGARPADADAATERLPVVGR